MLLEVTYYQPSTQAFFAPSHDLARNFVTSPNGIPRERLVNNAKSKMAPSDLLHWRRVIKLFKILLFIPSGNSNLACYSCIWKRPVSPTFKDVSSIIFPLIFWLGSWLQNFKLLVVVHVFSAYFHMYTWPLSEAFGTPCSFSDCTVNVLFGCRY